MQPEIDEIDFKPIPEAERPTVLGLLRAMYERTEGVQRMPPAPALPPRPELLLLKRA